MAPITAFSSGIFLRDLHNKFVKIIYKKDAKRSLSALYPDKKAFLLRRQGNMISRR